MLDTGARIGIYGWSPGTGGVHHHRIAEPVRVIQERGGHAETGVHLDDTVLGSYSAILVHTIHDERNTAAWQDLARLETHLMIFDVDDWMWRPDFLPFKKNYTPEALSRLFRNVAVSHVVTTPSEVIADYLSRHNANVHVVPNTVPAWLLGHEMPGRPYPTVGYQGSTHHIGDWTPSELHQVARFLRDHDRWDLHSYGPIEFQGAPERLVVRDGQVQRVPRTRNTRWVADIASYYRSVSMDVGIGPLKDTPFNRAKSSLRAIEYAALGVVAVLPDLAPYRGWVEDGVTGVLVRGGSRRHNSLYKALRQVAEDPEWREKAAAMARQRAAEWTTEASIGKWVRAWQSLSS